MMSLSAHVGSLLHRWNEHFSCGRLQCQGRTRVWNRLSDGDGTVSLAGKRYCFPSCFEQELRERFQQLRVAPRTKWRSLHRVPLGLLMLSRGDLSHEQLRTALQTQRQKGYGRIGEWIAELGFASEPQITAALGAQWSCPVLWKFPRRLADCSIPIPLLRRFRMAPVHYVKATNNVHIAFAGNVDYRALLAIEQVMQCVAEPCVTSSSALNGILARIEDEQRRTDHVFADSPDPAEMTRITSSYAAKLRVADVRLTQCGDYIWLRLEAEADSVNLLFTNSVSLPLESPAPPADELLNGHRDWSTWKTADPGAGYSPAQWLRGAWKPAGGLPQPDAALGRAALESVASGAAGPE